MGISNAALAIAEETVAEVTVLVKNHQKYINKQIGNNHQLLVLDRCPKLDHQLLPCQKRRKFAL